MAFKYEVSEYAASTYSMYSSPLGTALDACRKYGFDDVEIWADINHLDPRANPDIDSIQAKIKNNSQKVHSIHLPILHPFPHPEDEAEFYRYRLALYEKTLDYAEKLDCHICVLHAFDPHFYPYTLSRLDELRERLGEIAQYASRRGVKIAVENMPYIPKDDWIVTTLADQSAYFKGLDVYYCLDIGHVPLLGRADCQSEISAAKDRLITFHVHNNYGIIDDHNTPDDGTLDWPAIHDFARANGYKGKFVLEVNEREGGERILRECAQLCRSI